METELGAVKGRELRRTLAFVGQSGGFANDELGINHDFAADAVLTFGVADKVVEHDVSNAVARDVDGGEGRGAELGQLNVVKSSDGHVFGNLQAVLAQLSHDADSHKVVDAENGGGMKAGLKELARGLASAFEAVGAGKDFSFGAR